MSSKKKKQAILWVQCDKCGVTVHDRDVGNHGNDCPIGNSSMYSYVTPANILHCSLEVHNKKDLDNLEMIQDPEALVLMSNAALQFCAIPIGDPVLISGSSCQIVRKCWRGDDRPYLAASLSENDVALCDFPQGSLVSIEGLSQKVEIAQEIIVTSCDSIDSPEILLCLQRAHQNQIFQTGNSVTISFFGKRIVFKIVEISPLNSAAEFYKTLPFTVWSEQKEPEDEILLNPIGGLKASTLDVEESLKSIFHKKTQHDKLREGGVILYGPYGTGKTLLMNSLAQKWVKNVIRISIDHLNLRQDGGLEQEIKQKFVQAQRGAPSIITIDDVDILCSKINNTVAATLASLMDRLNSSKSQTIVLATASNLNQVDRSLRRPGRFDKEIEIGVPTPRDRLEILEALLSREKTCLTPLCLQKVADSTHGFVGADLAALLTKALTVACNENSSLNDDYLLSCLPHIKPSAMREIMVQVPNVSWEDIGGQEELKHQLRQAVEWPLKYPHSFVRLGVSPPRGVLMYGPPGCSKTMVAKALATESGLNFISVKGPELFSKWVGESEKAVREVFRRARLAAPSIVFFDELDALAGERSASSGGAQVQERVLAQLLTELDGVEVLGHVIVVGATNRPDRIDPALLRPGRLDRLVYVPLPDEKTRSEIFRIQFRKTPVGEDVNILELARLTNRYSGAEVVAVCNEAAMFALDESMEIKVVARRHFIAALKAINPRTPESSIKVCEKYRN